MRFHLHASIYAEFRAELVGEDILVSVVSFSRQKWVLFLVSCPVERLKWLWTHREILTSIRLVHLSQKSAEIEK